MVYLTDKEFIQRFENCEYTGAEWTHEAHLRMGWYYLNLYGFREATEKARIGIQKLNSVIGVQGRGYHETITCFYMAVLDYYLLVSIEKGWPSFLSRNEFLLGRTFLSQFYSEASLNSPEAKETYVLPDLKKLPVPKQSVRDLRDEDIDQIEAYWSGLNEDDLKRMYIDTKKLLVGEVFRNRVKGFLATPRSERKVDWQMWEVEGQTIGILTLLFDGAQGEPRVHLHIFDPRYRGRGFGLWFFRESCLKFMGRFKLEKIYCEPAATNIFPNRLLQKLGCTLERTYFGVASAICFEQQINRYVITREKLL